jgi:AcrR family transcriptional regulator
MSETSSKDKSKTSRRAGAPSGPRQAEQKKALLIETAGRLFVEKGYDKTTMDDIAASANVAKGTLYHYYKNKSEILMALRADFEIKIMNRIKPKVEKCSPNDWKERIKAWTEAAVDAYFEFSKLHDVVIYGTGMPFRNAMADAEITQYLTEIIRKGAKAGAWLIDDPEWTATIIFYAFRGGCDEVIVGAQPAKNISEKLNEIFARILGI